MLDAAEEKEKCGLPGKLRDKPALLLTSGLRNTPSTEKH
jgi:hypothetical protein